VLPDVLVAAGTATLFSVLTFSGIAGFRVSLALQNTLSRMISGILLRSDGVLQLA